MKISIYSIVLPRLEVPFLDEWIEHHVALGVDEIYLYNNGLLPIHDPNAHWRRGAKIKKAPQKRRMEQLSKISDEKKPYIWEKKPDANYNFHLSDEEVMHQFYSLPEKWPQVKIVEWVKGADHDFGYPVSQKEGLYHFAENFKTDWVLFIDPDEFITLNKECDHCSNLKSFISFHKKYKMFKIPPIWAPKRMIGEKITENFPRRVRSGADGCGKWLAKITNKSDIIAYPSCHNVKVKDRKYVPRKKVKGYLGEKNPEVAFFHCN